MAGLVIATLKKISMTPSAIAKSSIIMMSSNFCPHLIFKFGDLIEFSVLKD